mmetsp:Transcript_31219/g.57060  ORF Transcript_31219/g.57060 Transcript_31219/m.57060 type:complete len:227 (+) Transcript_31219:632-1312(+)
MPSSLLSSGGIGGKKTTPAGCFARIICASLPRASLLSCCSMESCFLATANHFDARSLAFATSCESCCSSRMSSASSAASVFTPPLECSLRASSMRTSERQSMRWCSQRIFRFLFSSAASLVVSESRLLRRFRNASTSPFSSFALPLLSGTTPGMRKRSPDIKGLIGCTGLSSRRMSSRLGSAVCTPMCMAAEEADALCMPASLSISASLAAILGGSNACSISLRSL